MGIYINGVVDNITSTDGSLTISSFTTLRDAGSLTVSGISTFSNVVVGSAQSVTSGQTFIRNNVVGVGTTNTTGRDAGIGTARGTIIYNATTARIEFWDGSSWVGVST